MARISFLLFVVALIAFLNAYEAHRVGKFNEAFEKDLQKAEAMIEEDLKAMRMHVQGLNTEVQTLSKSEATLSEIGDTYKDKKLKKFSRIILKRAPRQKKKPGSIIQNILKDLGLNGGRT